MKLAQLVGIFSDVVMPLWKKGMCCLGSLLSSITTNLLASILTYIKIACRFKGDTSPAGSTGQRIPCFHFVCKRSPTSDSSHVDIWSMLEIIATFLSSHDKTQKKSVLFGFLWVWGPLSSVLLRCLYADIKPTSETLKPTLKSEETTSPYPTDEETTECGDGCGEGDGT